MNDQRNDEGAWLGLRHRMISFKTLPVIVFLGTLILTPTAGGQKLEHVTNFWALSGNVQFLPGGYVVKTEGGATERYIYRKSKFERLQGEIPSVVKNWTAFDWNWDFYDEINRHTADPNVKQYLPKGAKIKKVLDIPLDGGKVELKLACYTLRPAKEADPDIFVTGLLNATPHYIQDGPQYRKLWTLKAQSGAWFGDLQYQTIPGAGAFVLLYSAAAGADSVEVDLDVYRLNDGQELGKKESLRK